MAKTEAEVLKVPLIQEYNKTEELSVSHIYKLRPEELSLLFRKEHLKVPDNEGEKRESLTILEKVGMQDGLLKCLSTDSSTGIIGDPRDIKRRQVFFGINDKKMPKMRSYWRVLWEQFEDSALRILLVAATITILLGWYQYETDKYQWVQGASIYFAVAFIALFASASNFLKEKQFLKLFDEVKNEEVSVIRGQYGLSQPCKVFDLVVGDIIMVESGMRIPADCLLLQGMDITLDEAPYFEDRETINKKSLSVGSIENNNHTQNPDPFLLTDSLVMSGSGTAVVCCVGKNRFICTLGQEHKLFGSDENLTPLQQRLERIASQLSKWGYAVGCLVFVTMCFFLIMKILFSESRFYETSTLTKILDFFTISLAVIIVAVPEGLPLSLSIAMAWSIDILKKDHLLVKELKAIEQMGQVMEICTGKTATLTKNDMTVNRFYVAEKTIINSEPNTFTSCDLNQKVLDTVTDCIINNCEARIEMSDDAMYVPQGNGTEIGILKMLTSNEISIHDLLTKKKREGKIETNIAFGPFRKRQVTAIKPNPDSEFVRVIVKGAPEYVIPMCNSQLNGDGEVQEMGESERQLIEEEFVKKSAKSALRTLAYAYKDYSVYEWESMKETYNGFEKEEDRIALEQNLVFLICFALDDDLREGVSEIIKKLNVGGVIVRMISGDHKDTAVAVAQKTGILTGEDLKREASVMLGKDFKELVGGVRKVQDEKGNEKWEVVNKANFKTIAGSLKVLARATPEDKFALIVGLRDLGANVAVTADGLNDAQALKTANVGLCMGISGCQVAKESSDIILLDDNFKSVFRATQWGRNLNDNVRKFIQFQLTVSISALAIVLLSGATLGDTPFNVIQLLWINMVMDTLAAIALATEPPHPTELKQGRVKKFDKVFMPEMWRTILGQSAYQFLVMVVLLYAGPWMFGIPYDLINTPLTVTSNNPLIANLPSNKLIHYTFMFNTFMMMNLFNEINSRKLGSKDFNIFASFFNNLLFLIIVGGQFFIQWMVVEWGGIVGTIFGTTPLPLSMIIASLSFGVGSLIIGAILKATPDTWLDKIKVRLNEEQGAEDEQDFISLMHGKVVGSLKRSETERLLDSQ